MVRYQNLKYLEPTTVIIPARNAQETIARAVDSAHRCGADRILVYDDGSTDGTFDILDTMLEKYEELELFSASEYRAGVVFGRNYLVEQADFGLICPLDADDVLVNLDILRQTYQDEYTRRQKENGETEPMLWVYGDWFEFGDYEQKVTAPPPGSLQRKPLCYATMLFHKRDFERVGGYDVDFGFAEDYGLQCALTNAGAIPVYCNTVIHERHIHGGGWRTRKASEYWPFYQTMAKQKYQHVFRYGYG